MRKNLWLIASVVAALAGCGGGRTLYHGGDVPSVPQNDVYALLSGAPIPSVTPGVNAGYYITGTAPNSFRITWTGDAYDTGVTRHFTGSVYTTGYFSSVTPGCQGGICALQDGNLVSTVHDTAGGQRVDWDALSDYYIEGFDFVATTPVYFYTMVDDAPRADLSYFVGADGAVYSAVNEPFGLVPQ